MVNHDHPLPQAILIAALPVLIVVSAALLLVSAKADVWPADTASSAGSTETVAADTQVLSVVNVALR